MATGQPMEGGSRAEGGETTGCCDGHEAKGGAGENGADGATNESVASLGGEGERGGDELRGHRTK